MTKGDRFLVRQWADGCVVFDRLRGDTHAFSADAMSQCFDDDHLHMVPSRIQALIDSSAALSSGASSEGCESLPHGPSLATVISN